MEVPHATLLDHGFAVLATPHPATARFELSVASPKVITKIDEDGNELEPAEEVSIEVPEKLSGAVVEKMQGRGGTLLNMELGDNERTKLEFICPSRGLIGLRVGAKSRKFRACLFHTSNG
jgi:predicted membrane GTPase involved in stress response